MNTIEEFYEYLYSEIKSEARIEDEERFEEEIFTERMIEYLHETNILENGVVCRHKSRGLKIDGYDFNATGNEVDILITHYEDAGKEIPKIGKKEIDTAYKRAKNFLEKSRILTGLQEILDESAEALDFAKQIHTNYNNLKRSRIILLTNGRVGAQPAVIEHFGDFEIVFQVWDIERLWRSVSSGMKKEVITLEFENEGYDPLEFVSISDSRGIYTTYIAIIEGALLKDLYDRYGTRLLERNVRAFLQAKSNVNRGIRDTIIEAPNMFLAFNNGVTVTANSVSIVENQFGRPAISKITDFQVVNGGQTVASLWHTNVKNKAKIEDVFLQMKLTVINEKENIDIIAPLISKYSNAQNSVNTADFSANDPFHRNLEKISRTLYAPDPTGGNVETIWFYERSRGSYAETRNQERTPARIKTWKKIHPTNQRLDKLIVAKLENTWRIQPQIVSLGGQKNFSHFMVYVNERIAENKEIEVDAQYYKDLVAKQIIWKATEKIINRQKIPGYRANIVTYSLSWMLLHDKEKFNLDVIWKHQKISKEQEQYLDILTRNIRNKILKTAKGNVTEWCKSNKSGYSECWEKIKVMEIDFNQKVPDYIPSSEGEEKGKNKVQIDWNLFTQHQVWYSLSEWIEETKKLDQKDAEFSRRIGDTIHAKKNPSVKQIPIALEIMKTAVEKGFIIAE